MADRSRRCSTSSRTRGGRSARSPACRSTTSRLPSCTRRTSTATITRTSPGRCSASLASCRRPGRPPCTRAEEHTSELQSRENLVCRLLLEKKKKKKKTKSKKKKKHTIKQNINKKKKI